MSRQTRFLAALLGAALFAVPAWAQTTFNFTSPNFLPGQLNGQQAWNAEGSWVTGDTAGAGYVSTSTNNEIATYSQPITLVSPSDTFSYSVNFEFGGGPYMTPSAFTYAFMSGLTDDPSGSAHIATGGTAADAVLQIVNGTDNYRLLNGFSGIGGASSITGTELNAGDILQYDYTFTLGTDAATSSYDVRLQNLTDGTDTGVGTITGVDASVYNAITGGGAYAFVQRTNPGNGGTGLTSLQINSIGDLPDPPVTTPQVTYDFTSPDFSDGTLAIQQGWNAGAGWSVADSAGAGNANTTTQSQGATHLAPITLGVGESFNANLNFEFDGALAPLSGGFTYLMQTGLKATNDNGTVPFGSTAADAGLQQYGPEGARDNYRLLNNFTATSAAITNGAMDAGDQLQIDYTLTLGADAASTVVDLNLNNITDSEFSAGTYTGIDQSVYDALTGDGAYYFFQSNSFAANDSGVTKMQVNSVTGDFGTPPVLPTPGTPEAPSPLTGTNLFTDTFDRADSTGPTAAADDSTTGMSSAVFTPAVGTTYAEFEGSFAPGDGPGGIENNKLSLGLGNGEAMAGIDRNFTDAEILTAGGFAIEAIVDPNNDTVANGTSGADDNRYFAIGVGLTQAAATTETMVDGGTGEGSNADRQVLEQAAFAFTLEDDGQYNAFDSWAKDQQPNFPGQEVNLTNTTTVTPLPTDVRHDEASVIDDGDAMTFGQNDFLAQTGLAIEQDEYKLRLEFRFTDFNAGTDVEVTAFIEDVQIDLDPSNGIEANPGDRDTYTFQWDGTNQNYVMFQGRPGSDGESTADFLMIETLAAVGVPGDFDGDGFVGLSDLNILGANFGAVGTGTLATGDANGDGDVDLADLNILGANWNPPPAVSVPEPTTLALAAFAAAGFLARRRS